MKQLMWFYFTNGQKAIWWQVAYLLCSLPFSLSWAVWTGPPWLWTRPIDWRTMILSSTRLFLNLIPTIDFWLRVPLYRTPSKNCGLFSTSSCQTSKSYFLYANDHVLFDAWLMVSFAICVEGYFHVFSVWVKVNLTLLKVLQVGWFWGETFICSEDRVC